MSNPIHYKTPRCSACQHTLRWYRSHNVWKCNFCPAIFTAEQAAQMYDPEVPETYDINDFTIFRKQEGAATAAPATATVGTSQVNKIFGEMGSASRSAK